MIRRTLAKLAKIKGLQNQGIYMYSTYIYKSIEDFKKMNTVLSKEHLNMFVPKQH